MNQEKIINTFFNYVSIASESRNEKAFAERIKADLEEMGYTVELDNSGLEYGSDAGNLYCYIPGTMEGEPLMYSCHMDTVTPGVGIEPYIDGEYITSRTETILAGDDKAGITAVMEALRKIKEDNLLHRPIEIIFSFCEEIGLVGAKAFDASRFKCKNGFVLDSGGPAGEIIVTAPGHMNMTAVIKGKAAHAGIAPENGVSAIMVAAEAISNMKLLRIDEETTANIGSVAAEGANNIVSPECTVKMEARSLNLNKLNSQTEHMIECFKAAAEKYGAEVSCKPVILYEPFNLKEDEPFIQWAMEQFKAVGITPFTGATGGGSDASIYNAKGMLILNIGMGSELVHTTNEKIKISELMNLTRFVLQTMTN